MNQAIVSLGSNIDPRVNIEKACAILSQMFNVLKQSQFVQTKPVAFIEQDDFINGAILLETLLNEEALCLALKNIESAMGRVKTTNKNGPRCIDLDIVVWNGKIIDPNVNERDFLQQSIRELLDGGAE